MGNSFSQSFDWLILATKVLILVVLRSELQEYGELDHWKTPFGGSAWSPSGSRRARTKEWRTCARCVASGLPKALTLPLLEKVNCARRFKGSLISRGFVLRPDDQSSSCARFPCLFPRCLSCILLETFSEAPLKSNARRSRCAARLHIRINCRPCGAAMMRLER